MGKIRKLEVEEIPDNAPENISFDLLECVADLRFHKSQDLLLSGFYAGNVRLHSYSADKEVGNKELWNAELHTDIARIVDFVPDTDKFFTVGRDSAMHIAELETGKICQTFKDIHPSITHAAYPMTDNLIATGDDDGTLKLWDLRNNKVNWETKVAEDFISDMLTNDTNRILVASSADGSINAMDVRNHKMKVQSEFIKAEFLCMAPLWYKTKLAVGSERGIIYIYNMNELGSIQHMLAGVRSSVDCIVAINEQIVCTGDVNGTIRAANVCPNNYYGTVAKHKHESLNRLRVSRCGKYMASSTEEDTIRFYDLEIINLLKKLPRRYTKKGRTSMNKDAHLQTVKSNFFAGMEKDEDVFALKKDEDDEKDGQEEICSEDDYSDLDSDVHESDFSDVDSDIDDFEEIKDGESSSSKSDKPTANGASTSRKRKHKKQESGDDSDSDDDT